MKDGAIGINQSEWSKKLDRTSSIQKSLNSRFNLIPKMLGPIDKRIYEKATGLLEKGSRIEMHEPQEVIEKDYDKKRVEEIISCVLKQFPKIKSGLFSYFKSEPTFRVYDSNHTLIDNSETYRLKVYLRKKWEMGNFIVPLLYLSRRVFFYYKRTKLNHKTGQSMSRDAVLVSKDSNFGDWHSKFDTFFNKYQK